MVVINTGKNSECMKLRSSLFKSLKVFDPRTPLENVDPNFQETITAFRKHAETCESCVIFLDEITEDIERKLGFKFI